MSTREKSNEQLTFGEHLEILRKMLLRIIIVVVIIGIVIFSFKKVTFNILLAPHNSDFVTFRVIEDLLHSIGCDFTFPEYDTLLISTELSSQFMTHITVSCILGVLFASPYVLYELFKFISPALYQHERTYSYIVACVIYFLFVIGLLMTYYVIFPISFQFLANYQVDENIKNTITLDSYVSTFTTLTFLMGIVFQLPVIVFVLGKMGLVTVQLLKRYRPYAFILIMIIAAIITPPDLFTLVIVTIPIYCLYELSIIILKITIRKLK